jgi:hypothetical protein
MADGTAPTCGRVGSRHSFSTAFQCQLKGCFAIREKQENCIYALL